MRNGVTTIADYVREKPLCIVCPGASIDGDVILLGKGFGKYIGDFTTAMQVLSSGKENPPTLIYNVRFYTSYRSSKGIKIKFLYLWHILVMRKSAKYLTGINRRQVNGG